MKEIKKLSEQIDDELEGAEKYIKCALNHKEDNPALSEMYFTLANAEMEHVTALHNAVVKMINDYKAQGATIPEGMQTLYDYLHERHIKWANKVREKIDRYKQS